ncbi:aldo/keto reductase [Herbiconiux ginsengi]|uniref:D-threo-aldose 1-dehydrogenase n=1 Tax=Herbiconiux ginsengi TaxID=381665 RepID=A0A1H3QMX9_9MICO|nr:aldo/keto reductase [Herbiconiux ginsengi]SDZ14912.1 D-threo-aldose 1-dehydrogenase [Herbiconiux ginsengi]
MTDLRQTRPFGRTGFDVTPLALGTSSWGRVRAGESGDERDARILEVAHAFFAGALETDLLDTSNMYGATDAGHLSELFVGRALAQAGGVAPGLVVQTKLDRDTVTDDFSGRRMRRSLEESLDRLGLDRVDVLYLHDPEVVGFETVMEPGGAVDALVQMKEQGLATAIGISGGPVDMLLRFIETDLFDALVTHNRFTLLDRSAAPLLDAAADRNVGVANAAPYGGGVLTGEPGLAGRYGYRPISAARAAALSRLREIAERHGLAMGALALGFSLRDPRVHTTIVGASSLDRWTQAVTDATAAASVPEEVWAELADLADGLPPHDA